TLTQLPPRVEKQIDVREGLEPRPEPGLSPADALRGCPDPAGLASEHGDDAVGFAQFLGAQHDAVVAVDAHRVILAHHGRHPPAAACQAAPRISPWRRSQACAASVSDTTLRP